MLQKRIDGLGLGGLNFDQPSWNLAPNVFSFGQNVRTYRGRLRNFGGRENTTTAPIQVFSLFGFQTPDRETIWIEGGIAKVYVWDGSNHTDITRLSGDYTMDEYTDHWTGGIQSEIGFLCNGFADGPQQWLPVNAATRLVDMVYDPSGAPGSQTWEELNYRAYAMKPYSGTIVAMNVRRDTLRLPATVQWCDFISIGDTTTDWVPRTTNSAGEKTLGETSGNIIDGAPLRDDFIIYKEDAVYRMSFTGNARSPFIFRRLPEYVRIINRGCIGVTDEFHVLASRSDVMLFDGNTFTSIFDTAEGSTMREYYRENMFAERLATTFVFVLNKESEVWICRPKNDQPGAIKYADEAIVWNYRTNSMSITDLPGCRDMDEGVIVGQIFDRFDDVTPNDLAFDQDFSRFDESPFQQSLSFAIGAHGNEVSVFGEQPTDNGTPRVCRAERLGLVLEDEATGIKTVDSTNRMREVRLHLESTSPMTVQFGGQMTPTSSVIWDPIQTFDPTTQSYLSTRTQFKYFAYRIFTEQEAEWEITSIEFRWKRVRNR